MKYFLLICTLALGSQWAFAIEKTDEFRFEFPMENLDGIRLYNHKGNVTVKGIQGNTAKLVVKRRIKAQSQRSLAYGLENIQVDSILVDNEILVFLRLPNLFLKANENGHYYYNSDWNQWDKNDLKNKGVGYEFHFTIEMPIKKMLVASTHFGEVEVERFTGPLHARNHHGSIHLTDVKDLIEADTHHGDIQVDFADNSSQDFLCNTHHGDITIACTGDLSAQIGLRTKHGELLSDFDWKHLPARVEAYDKGKGTHYKVKNRTHIQIGDGDRNLELETYHGNIYIKRKNS